MSNREIFSVQLPDGAARRYDPMVVERDLARARARVDWDGLMSRWMGPPFLGHLDDAARLEAEGITPEMVDRASREIEDADCELAPLVAPAFGLRMLADDPEGGFTTNEVIQIYLSYHQWIGNLKKNTDPNATSPQPTGGESPTTPRPDSPTTS